MFIKFLFPLLEQFIFASIFVPFKRVWKFFAPFWNFFSSIRNIFRSYFLDKNAKNNNKAFFIIFERSSRLKFPNDKRVRRSTFNTHSQEKNNLSRKLMCASISIRFLQIEKIRSLQDYLYTPSALFLIWIPEWLLKSNSL